MRVRLCARGTRRGFSTPIPPAAEEHPDPSERASKKKEEEEERTRTGEGGGGTQRNRDGEIYLPR